MKVERKNDSWVKVTTQPRGNYYQEGNQLDSPLGQKNTLAIWFYSRSLQPHGTTWLPKAHGGVPPQPTPLGRGGLWAALFFSVTLGFILSLLFPSCNTSLLYPVQGRHTGRVSRHS